MKVREQVYDMHWGQNRQPGTLLAYLRVTRGAMGIPMASPVERFSGV